MHYVAHADLAFESVEYIMRNVNYGWLIRCIRLAMCHLMSFSEAMPMIHRSLRLLRDHITLQSSNMVIGLMIYLLAMAAASCGYVAFEY